MATQSPESRAGATSSGEVRSPEVDPQRPSGDFCKSHGEGCVCPPSPRGQMLSEKMSRTKREREEGGRERVCRANSAQACLGLAPLDVPSLRATRAATALLRRRAGSCPAYEVSDRGSQARGRLCIRPPPLHFSLRSVSTPSPRPGP